MLDTKDVFEKFYSNVIALSVLGVCTSCNYDEKSKVHEVACEIQNSLMSVSGAIKILILNHFFWLTKIFPVKIFSPTIYDFFQDHVIEEIKKRERKKIDNRRDFLQRVIAMRKESDGLINWNDGELIVAQVMSFFTAGFSTTSTLFQACCFVLAKNEKIQNEFYQNCDVENSKFIDNFLQEILRKWTPIFMTSRVCEKDFTIHCKNGENYNFYKGDLIEIPLRLINNDLRLIDDPKLINPQRTDNQNISFGIKPRDCVGRHFSLFLVKNLLTSMVKKFIISYKQTPCELKFCDSQLTSEIGEVKLKYRNL